MAKPLKERKLKMQFDIEPFFIGIAVGLFLFRICEEVMMGTSNPTICDYCKLKKRRDHFK